MCSVEDSWCSIYYINARHSISVQKFFYGYNHCLLCQVEEDFVWVCVWVCVGVLKRRLSEDQVLLGEKFYLFLQQVVPGDAPILKMITSVPIKSAHHSPDP